MTKIIKLDKNLANQIAAWEVVERPVSVVKELVENSIDAKAKNIRVQIKNWGIDEIIVSDDWEWIDKDDLEIIVEKYTTSKIKTIEDLYNVMTFWFRWEALSSISSVSKISIISKIDKNNFWNILSVEWWDKKEIMQIASEIWTKIIVKELFYNTPARLNYLKKSQTEYSHILEFLNAISLSYPEIWFEFISDDRQVFKYKQDENLQTRIYNIYSKELSENLIKIDFELTWINISWYISDPKVSFSNKNRQNIFVNNRIVKSSLVYKAISDAYNRFIPHSSFPAYILNLKIDPTQIDVNVHPRKLEVRFAWESNVYKAFYHSILDKLEKTTLLSKQENNDIWFNQSNYLKNDFRQNGQTEKYHIWSWTKFKSYSPYSIKNVNPSQENIWSSIKFTKELLNNSFNNISTDLHDTPLWKIIWQSHNSFIIVETQDSIKFLDQHALAERIIYEKLVNQTKINQTQRLLIWENINLTPKEFDVFEENKNTFFEMWFDFEIISSNTIILNWVPEFVQKQDLQKIIMWIIEDIWNLSISKSKTLQEVKNKIYAYTACRSAIKFWHKLNLFEMNKLINDSILDYSSTCPHWRPVVFEISLNELKSKYER